MNLIGRASMAARRYNVSEAQGGLRECSYNSPSIFSISCSVM